MSAVAHSSRSNVADQASGRPITSTTRLRAFFWSHLLPTANEVTTMIVIDTTANAVIAVLNRHGKPLDPVIEAAVRRSLDDNADLFGGSYAALADDL